MENSILLKLIKLTKSSEIKYKIKDYKGAIEDKREANMILNSDLCDKEVRSKYLNEISKIYISKFDLIYDHKKLIDDIQRDKIVKLLQQKSEDKYIIGDYKGAIKALRRAEKYQQ